MLRVLRVETAREMVKAFCREGERSGSFLSAQANAAFTRTQMYLYYTSLEDPNPICF